MKVCNMCGKVLDTWDQQEDFSIEKDKLGYGTSYDGEGLSLHLCCDCMEEIINSCQVNPIIEDGGQILLEDWS